MNSNPLIRIRPSAVRALLILWFCAGAVTAAPALADDSVVLGSGRDNTLYESATGALSNGAGTGFFAGRTNQVSGSIRRGLVWFDLAGIPAGSTIISVELQLTMSQTSSGAMNVSLHRVSASWGEGASDAGPSGGSGAPAQPGDATWKHRVYPGTLWAALGGDFVAAASATQSVGAAGNYMWTSTPALLADVQSWLDAPAGNHGWLLRGNEAIAQTVKKFESRESTEPAFRPALTVQYAQPTPAAPVSWGRIKGLYR